MNERALERLNVHDSAANVELSRSVGWNDVEPDWHTLYAAAEVLGVREGPRLIAQGALADYGTAASVAKMVVAPDRQGQGLGRLVLDRLIGSARARGLALGLCATDQGRPLYEKAGFSASGEVVVLLGTLDGMGAPGSVVSLEDAESATRIERRFVPCDRSRMLAARYAQSSVAVRLRAGAGFALATPADGGAVLGPIVAESEDGAKELVLAAATQLAGPMRVDVPMEHASFRAWLVRQGLREVSQRVEMAFGAQRAAWQVPQRFALATQAWG